jgi:hypothetical protein
MGDFKKALGRKPKGSRSFARCCTGYDNLPKESAFFNLLKAIMFIIIITINNFHLVKERGQC